MEVEEWFVCRSYYGTILLIAQDIDVMFVYSCAYNGYKLKTNLQWQ